MGNDFEFTVTGVLDKLPTNSIFNFDMLVRFEIVKEFGWDTETWNFSMAETYVLIEEKVSFYDFENKIKSIVKDNNPNSNVELFIQPLEDIYLYSEFSSSGKNGKIIYLYIFSIIGSLILLMACINFTNLSTARAEKRSREIGLRKVVGARRSHLIFQFLFEAVIMVSFSVMLIPLFILITLPWFNNITGVNFYYADLWNRNNIIVLVFASLMTGLLSGSYPAMLLSSFNPAKALKGRSLNNIMAGNLRKNISC